MKFKLEIFTRDFKLSSAKEMNLPIDWLIDCKISFLGYTAAHIAGVQQQTIGVTVGLGDVVQVNSRIHWID